MAAPKKKGIDFSKENQSIDPSTLKVAKKLERATTFWNFKERAILYCEYLEEEKMEYKVFRVKELTTGNEYYLPAHSQLEEAFENGNNYLYKIEHLEEITFKKGTKSFNTYDISLLEHPTK